MEKTTKRYPVFGKAPERRESHYDYVGRRLREERHKGGEMVDRTVAEKEIASMQEQVHGLQMRVKELSETVYSLSYKVSTLGGDTNQLELKL
ncbi:MAG: hypothetical protein CL506_01905 [Actinobacteria bacterium]|nr:hypothetical protein [Actinomycetota bacterium]